MSEGSLGVSGWKKADWVEMTQYIQCSVNCTQALTSNCDTFPFTGSNESICIEVNGKTFSEEKNIEI